MDSSGKCQFFRLNIKKNHTLFLDELNEGIADERVHYIQIALLRYKTLQKNLLSDTNLWLCLLSCRSIVRKGIEMGLALYEPYYAFYEEIKASSKKYVMQISAENLAQLCLLNWKKRKRLSGAYSGESLCSIF